MDSSASETMNVEVAFALPDEQIIVSMEVPPDTTVRGAVERSGLLDRFPQIDLTKNKLGVFGKVAKADQVLRAGDRVEIYRPLIADPKAVRKQRAAEGKCEGRRSLAELHPEAAEMARRLRQKDKGHKGLPLQQVAGALAEAGHSAANGQPFTARQVQKLALKPALKKAHSETA